MAGRAGDQLSDLLGDDHEGLSSKARAIGGLMFNEDMEWISLLVLLAVLGQLMVGGRGRRAADRQARQLAAVERKLGLIMDHLGIREPEPDAPATVLEELMAGRKLQAIKVYRDATHTSLTEAKDAVELLARRYGLE
ncbi:hypothetical protein AB0C02_17905 [Micromonospora sp. NPDC048999]|uniref:hypothetical protein n=1 Tax=Micromonospora sp. NPDC048999 TaxID=3155391 RepID=UPI0033F22F26